MKLAAMLVVMTVLALGHGGALLPRAFGANLMSHTSEIDQDPLPLLNYLVQLGQAYDCFFTIEEAHEVSDQPNDVMEGRWIQASSSRKNLRDELEHLRQVVPNFTYEFSKNEPRIIHIKDARLAHQKGSGLDSVLKSIDFTGRLNDLPQAISKQGVAVSGQSVIFTNETRDFTTMIQIKADTLKVRDVLTDFVPLKGRLMKILWIAKTELGQGKVSYVYYP
jgi:RNA recognition motif-containing protein